MFTDYSPPHLTHLIGMRLDYTGMVGIASYES
jgi:hypothetical protein